MNDMTEITELPELESKGHYATMCDSIKDAVAKAVSENSHYNAELFATTKSPREARNRRVFTDKRVGRLISFNRSAFLESLKLRPELHDGWIAEHVHGYYKDLSYDGVILDFGAHVGSFLKYATQAYAQAPLVVCVEPEPTNFSLLQENARNLDSNKYVLIEAAADNCNSDFSTPLWVSGSNSGLHCLIRGPRRDQIHVSSIQWWDLVSKYEPKVLKIDIEGAEHELLLREPIHECVKELALELHALKRCGDWRKTLDLIRNQGFVPDKPVKELGEGQIANVIFRR
jgi:FkbM family methyltransferase